MKKFVNATLILVSIISLIIVLKLSSLPVLCFPNFFVTTLDVRETYYLVYDVCLGLLLSILFYFIVNVIPDCIRIKKSKKLTHLYIEQILREMNLIISISLAVYDRGDIKINDIALKDLTILNGNTNYSKKDISYHITEFNNKKKKLIGCHSYGNLNSIVKSSINNIKSNIENMKSYEYLYAINENLVEILRRIEVCKFIKSYEKKQRDATCYELANTHNEMYDFILLYKLLIKQKYHRKYSVIKLDSEEETKEYRKKLENGTYNEFSEDCHQKMMQKYIYYNPVLIIGDSYASKLVAEKFNRTFPVDIYSVSEVYAKNDIIKEQNKFRLVICIVTKETKKMFADILSNIDFPIDLFVINECEFIKRNYKINKLGNNIKLKKTYSYLKSKYILKKKVLLYKEHPKEVVTDSIVLDIRNYMIKDIDYMQV